MWKRLAWLSSGYQELDWCHTRGESEETCNTYMPLPSVNKVAHSGFETQRRVTKPPKKFLKKIDQLWVFLPDLKKNNYGRGNF